MSVMEKLNFQHPYSSFQCHMILQKSFKYADLIIQKNIVIINFENSCAS